MRQMLLSILAATLLVGCGAHPNGIAPANRAREIGAPASNVVGMTSAGGSRAAVKLLQVQRPFEVPAARQKAFEAFVEDFCKQTNVKYKLSASGTKGANAAYMLALEGPSAAAINQSFARLVAAWQALPITR
jgi:hypothetical protein